MSRREEPTFTTPPDPDDFETRLNAKLEARRRAEAEARKGPSGWALGVRYGSEFTGGVIVGGGLGYIADLVFGWTPFGLLVGVCLGFAAGALNVVRAAQSMNNASGAEDGPRDDA
ncbi:MAG: AtpZ/AtpI family protein [Pseudomonadota bacterium]